MPVLLTAHKRLPFHTQTFLRSADILHNNHHISKHRYKYSAGALPVYLDIGDKSLLVNTTQALHFFSKDLFSTYVIDMPGVLTASLHKLICNDDSTALHLPKSLNKWSNAFNVIYPQPITHCGAIIFLEQF